MTTVWAVLRRVPVPLVQEGLAAAVTLDSKSRTDIIDRFGVSAISA